MKYVNVSFRTFEMPLDDFRKMASADDVRIKVSFISSYVDAKFGKKNSNAIINSKFDGFLVLVDEQLKS